MTAGAGRKKNSLESAVLNTHDFLKHEDFLYYKEHLPAYFQYVDLYGFDANKHKANCITCDLAALAENPQLCHYHLIGFRYWELLKSRIEVYSGRAHGKGCPFRGGLNQLWRNQMLAFALQQKYASVTFSVCHHQKNTMLQRSIDQYKALIKNDKMFHSFTNYELLDAVGGSACADVIAWKKWYEEVYCF